MNAIKSEVEIYDRHVFEALAITVGLTGARASLAYILVRANVGFLLVAGVNK